MGKDNLATLDKSVHNEVTYEFFKNSNIIMRALNFYFSQLVFSKKYFHKPVSINRNDVARSGRKSHSFLAG